MKKLFSAILILAMVLSFGIFVFADEAVPGLPVYASAEEVDVAELLAGNALGKILDTFGNIELTYIMDAVFPDQTSHSESVFTEYLIDGVYYASGSQDYGDAVIESFYECNEADPYQYIKGTGYSDKAEYPVEKYMEHLNAPQVPYPEEGQVLDVQSVEDVDGLFVIDYSVSNADGSGHPQVATICIDPVTSLITAFKYVWPFDAEGVGYTEYKYDGTIAYGVDSEPNYSVRG